jgi:hypothetical protein
MMMMMIMMMMINHVFVSLPKTFRISGKSPVTGGRLEIVYSVEIGVGARGMVRKFLGK